MKPAFVTACLLLFTIVACTQPDAVVKQIKSELPPTNALAPLYFLASDSLKGRDAFRPEIKIAARYIQQQFKEVGLLQFPEAPDYAQSFPIDVVIKDNSEDTFHTAGINSAIKNGTGQNIIGYVKGTDPRYNDQFVLLSAHYDHIGVSKKPEMINGVADSIFNGARDNATGTTAVIDAARYFAKHPAKRPILFIVFSAEEEGLVGSTYFARHPVVSLNKIYCNLNIDNAGYNDTTIVTLVGSGKTSMDGIIHRSTAAFGLTTINDPSPEAGLFGDSDNAPFADAGVPAITYSLGFSRLDSVLKYLHHVTDETSTMNMNYILKFIEGYIFSAQSLANNSSQIQWTAGDAHEAAWHKLYGK